MYIDAERVGTGRWASWSCLGITVLQHMLKTGAWQRARKNIAGNYLAVRHQNMLDSNRGKADLVGAQMAPHHGMSRTDRCRYSLHLNTATWLKTALMLKILTGCR